MAKAKRGGKSYASGYANYKTNKTEEKNRLIKLTRLIKKQPNNLQLQAAVKDIHHRRNTPKAPVWSHQEIAVAKLVKYFTGKFTRDWFSTDPKVFASATHVRNTASFEQVKEEKISPHQMFTLKERARDKQGNFVWK